MTPASLASTRKHADSTPRPEPEGVQIEQEPREEKRPPGEGRGTRQRTTPWFKNAVDYLLGAVFLILTAPLFLVISLLIKLTSHGPVLYVQRRVGKDGKVFRFYKFRTMKANADDSMHREFSRDFIRAGRNGNGNGATGNGNGHGATDNGHSKANGHKHTRPTDKVYKMTRDPRVTTVGHLLRRSSLDELPQLFNVLRGEMSLVGPRPPVVYEIDHYQEWHKRRLEVKPGLTGLWQVSGRSCVPFDEMVALDLYYIENRSTLMDLRIISRTLPVMFRGDGAY